MYSFILYSFIIAIFICAVQTTYQIPEIKLEAFSPKGLRASLPDTPLVQLFAFHGKTNRPINNVEPGEYYNDVTEAVNGEWVFWDPNIQLDVGDTVYYWVSVQHDSLGYRKSELKWKVPDLKPLNNCTTSQTIVRGRSICSKDLIFEENFRGNAIDESKWTIEHRIASGPDYEFVSYQNDNDTCYIKEDVLYIKPRVETKVVKAVLDLKDGCTSTVEEDCYFKQLTYKILPPVTSGKMFTHFFFQYGTVEIKAKLPSGDWLYPELYLQHIGSPFFKTLIAYCRGNDKLTGNQNDDIGARLLFGGPIHNPVEPEKSKYLRSVRALTPYTKEMHVYKLIWEPGKMTFLVDDTEFGNVEVTYDKPLIINLGVGVGGVNDFPENYLSGSHQKPWKNNTPKQTKEFYDAKSAWSRTWNGEDSALQVDYVKVYAL